MEDFVVKMKTASLIFLYLVNTVVKGIDIPIVDIEDGKVAGIPYSLPNGKAVTAFFGIPYAAPPVYQQRFMPPQKVEPWSGLYNASTVASNCLQYSDFIWGSDGEEDCLYLNVFTPKLPSKTDSLLNVMVYIHGGAFMFGDQLMYPKYLMQDHDVVFVSMNYRLGILGFFSTGDTIVPGNNGLKDQLAAMKWVKKNIAKFGGNPDSITLAGSSAGGASVHYHMLSDASKGLFHRGISFSGAALPPWTLPRNNTEKSIHIGALAGCPTSSTAELVECLKTRPGRQLVELSRHFIVWRYEPFTAYGPTVEPDNPDGFLTEHPLKLLNAGRIMDIPFLITLCKDEGLYRGADIISKKHLLKELEKKWNIIAPNMLMYNYSVSSQEEKNKVSVALKKYYFGDKPISEQTTKQLVQAYGDRAFYNDIVRAMKIQASKNKEVIYCYKFSYRGKYSLTNLLAKDTQDYGVSHADDVSYVVDLLQLNMIETLTDRAVAELLNRIVANFMKCGHPGDFGGKCWDPVSKNIKDKFRCLDIISSDKYKMVDYEDTKTIKFWLKLLPLENEV